MSKHRRRADWQAVGVGLAATAAVLLLYALGGLDWLEYKTLDLRFLYANSIPQRSDLVCIDIDDAALQKIGRWPWPRDVQAGAISVLAGLGVKALLVDITLVEAEPLRPIVPRQADIAFDPVRLAEAQGQAIPVALPDHELRAAIEDVGPVYLATDYSVGKSWKDFLDSDAFAHLVELSKRGPAREAPQVVAQLHPRPRQEGEPAWDPWLWARMVAALEEQPMLDEPALAQRLDARPAGTVSQALSACRDLALRRRIHAWLALPPPRGPQPAQQLFDQLQTELLAGDARYLEDLAVALRRVLGDDAMTAAPIAALDHVGAAAPTVDAVSAVYFEHARAAKRCGFVAFDPDGDGVMRHTRLLVQHQGHVVPQLAFAVAFDALGLGPDDLRAEPGRLILRTPRGPLVIQLDGQGLALIPVDSQRDWRRQFGEHVPIDALWLVFDRQQSIMTNRALISERLGGLLPQPQFAEYRQYHEDLATRLKLDRQWRLARYRGDRQAVADCEKWIADGEKLLEAGEPPLRAALRVEISRASARPEVERNESSQAYLATLAELERAFAANDDYRVESRRTLDWLRPRIHGKIALLGYTATALADMTPIPTSPRAPGVMAHANLLSALLAGRTVRWAPAWLNGLLTAGLGVLAIVATLLRSPRGAAITVLLLALAYIVVAGQLAFYRGTYWIVLTPPLAAMVLSYAAILLPRYILSVRESRQLTTALSQYTSATLARKMAEDPALCQRAEAREVTTMFTDLADFTSISERIGAERTQHLLNVALGCFSDVMFRHEGMVNKFIGDGIFAFWNPVIYPQPDHARRACETAVDLLAALRELAEEQRRVGGDAVFGELVLRIGVASGSAVVGPCGSEQKYDYTCIGDSVNVASRLESANKFYGTRILISGATRDAVGDGFLFRPLGGVQVKGKTQAVPIFELLGRSGQVEAQRLDYARCFGKAVTSFQRRDWRHALELFEQCRASRPDDLAARQYAAATQRFMTGPPDEAWTGALELTEK